MKGYALIVIKDGKLQTPVVTGGVLWDLAGEAAEAGLVEPQKGRTVQIVDLTTGEVELRLTATFAGRPCWS